MSTDDDWKQMAREMPRVMNPLWIISLFLSLSEVTTGVGATQANGWIQALLAIFSVIFPLTITATFFMIVWRKPYVLYAPGDFPTHMPVNAYVEAMLSIPQPRYDMEPMIRAAIESAIPQIAKPGITEEERESVVDFAVQAARDDLARRTITIDLKNAYEFPPSGSVAAQIVVSDSTTVHHFSNEVYFALPKGFPAYTYGETWLLRDVDSGITFADMGRSWARAHGMPDDMRSLAEAGIQPGSRLEVVVIKRKDWRIVAALGDA